MWTYVSIIENEIDMAGKYRIRVLISKGEEEQTIFLKFKDSPTEEQIINETNKVCNSLNEEMS